MLFTAHVGPLPLVVRLPVPGAETPARPSAAQAFLVYATDRPELHGFPMLPATQRIVHAELLRLTGDALPCRSGGEVAAWLYFRLVRFCPRELAAWGGRYWLQAVELHLVEQTPLGVRAVPYTAECDGRDERLHLPLASGIGAGAFGDRRADDWIAAREESYVPLPAYAITLENGQVEVRLAEADSKGWLYRHEVAQAAAVMRQAGAAESEIAAAFGLSVGGPELVP